MSMFYELMMRKKEEIMYATIKGTLTENDGVFSGFSGTNYLTTQMGIDLSQKWEFSFDFTTSDDITSEQFVFTDKTYPYAIGFGIFTNSRFVLYFLNSSGNRVYNFLNSATINTHYKVKITYSNNNISVYINGELVNSQSSNYPSSYIDRIMYIGRGMPTALAFKGSIDLNNSYIKIGSTKYKLQAVVGYTIVGSPTITDGVVSGFSNANYLTLQSSVNSDNYDVIEFNTKITTGNSIADGLIIGISNFYVVGLTIIDSKLTCRTNFGSYVNAISDITLQANTTYTIKGIIDKRNSTISINVNGTINSASFTYETARTLNYRIGYSDALGSFNGSIDLNETYIKVDNKLWFNGQQA